jgi:hypothetical protein
MMNAMSKIRSRGAAFTVAVMAVLLLLFAPGAQAAIEGVTGSFFALTASAGEISIPDGGSVHAWGYGTDLMQYPGPTMMVTQGTPVTVTLVNSLPPWAGNTSMVFPGQTVSIVGPNGVDGELTREAELGGGAVTYTFTPTEPGTYTYYSGTNTEIQIEMGLTGALIVRPAAGDPGCPGNDTGWAYDHKASCYDDEYLFFLTDMDPEVHQLAEQGRMSEIDITGRFPVYWFINGRGGPDTMLGNFVDWLPHQPYDSGVLMEPGQKLLMRVVGGGRDLHPFHHHGNHARVIAKDGMLLTGPAESGSSMGPDLAYSVFTIPSVPGETVDAIFTWTGMGLNWDIYGTGPDYDHGTCISPGADDAVNNETGLAGADGFHDSTYEWCDDHGKEIPVTLPGLQDLAFGGWYSGSPFMGDMGDTPPGEGGLNPFAGFGFMWHSHTEKELANFDIFPGGMMTMLIVVPPGTLAGP